MIATIIGKKSLCFEDKKSNEKVELYTLFCTHKNPFNDNITQYEGEGCSQVNVPKDIFEGLVVGQKCSMDFDKKGKLLEVTEL